MPGHPQFWGGPGVGNGRTVKGCPRWILSLERGGSRTLVTVSMIGAAGRVYLGGATADIVRARDEITRVLGAVAGREQ